MSIMNSFACHLLRHFLQFWSSALLYCFRDLVSTFETTEDQFFEVLALGTCGLATAASTSFAINSNKRGALSNCVWCTPG